MSELRKRYVEDENLGPVRVAYFERWENGQRSAIEGFEIAFRESSPDMRNRVLWWFLVTVAFIMGIPFLLLLEPISTLMFAASWANGKLDGEGKFIGYVVLAGSACFLVLFSYVLRPPFRSDVVVTISPGDDRVRVSRGGKLAHDVPLSEAREVAIDKHPGLETAQIQYENRPNRVMKRHVTTYQQAESVLLVMGRTMAMNMVEIASVMGSDSMERSVQAMRIRSAIDGCLQMGKHLQSQMAARPAAPKATPSEPETVVRRRRRDKPQ
jgi:hypothetical protein